MTNEGIPIRVTHNEPIKVRPSSLPVSDEPVIVGPPVFLHQETAEKRGINSCVPTSFVNAAIGLGVIEPNLALGAHEQIMDALLRERDLWEGANLKVVNIEDSRLAEIIERYLPVRLGYNSDSLGRMMLVPRSFDGIRNDLASGTAHMISNDIAHHAYASIKSFPDKFFYVDPMQPSYYRQVSAQSFDRTFGADNNGWVNATLVRPLAL